MAKLFKITEGYGFQNWEEFGSKSTIFTSFYSNLRQNTYYLHDVLNMAIVIL